MTEYHSIMPSTASAHSSPARFVTDIITPLKDRVALLPGSRDRQKHPIIFFPSTDISANSEELKNILIYFYSVTADDSKPNGFIFIIGAKKGSSRQSVKPSTILQLINEYFPGKVIAAYIIVKGNNFFKSSSTSGKYKFHVQEITEENLTKFIDSSQLLREFGGNLHYDHEEWIEIRKDIEYVISKLSDCYKECETCYKLLQKKKFIEDNGNNGSSWPINAQDEFDKRLNSISTIDCDNDIRRVHQQIINAADERYKTPNPDFASVIPHLQKLGKHISKARSDLTQRYQRSILEQDQINQFRLLESQVNELKNRIIQEKACVDERFTIIGNNELEAQQLLKDHQRFDDAVEQSKVTYSHLLKHGSILIINFPSKKNEIDGILKDLENCWNYLTAVIEQRLTLINIVIAFRQETEIYFTKLPEWLQYIRNQSDNFEKPLTELEEIARNQENVENEIELSYSQAYDESMKLSQRLIMYLGQERAGKDSSYRHVLEIIQKLTRSQRELHSLFEDKKTKLAIKLSFAAFMEESNSVINWIEKYGFPYMKKKTTIGNSEEQAKDLIRHHQKFKNVAENTRKNAHQLYQVADKLIENGTAETEAIVQERLKQLNSVVHNFFDLMDHRQSMLTQSAMFHLHFKEIAQWYERIKDNSTLYEIVPNESEDCEILRDKLSQENEATAQAYATVIEESDKLIRMLKAQKEFLDVDTSADEAHIEEMTNLIETRHSKEIERWSYQRSCVQTGHLARIFLNECSSIYGQIIAWSEELKPFTHRNEKLLFEFLKCTDDNIKQVKDASKDFTKRYDELIQMIENSQLNLVDTNRQPINVLLNHNFDELDKIINETLMRANGLKEEMSLNRNIRETYNKANEVMSEIKYETDLLNQLMSHIPENKEEAMKLSAKFDEFRPRIEPVHHKFLEIKALLELFVGNAPDPNRRKDIMLKHSNLLRIWENYYAKRSDCTKFAAQAITFHNLNEALTPVIDHILKTSANHPTDYCLNSKTPDLLSYLSSLQTKHAGDKEKFLKASIHSRKVYDAFIRIIQKCPIQKEYRILKEQEIRKQMELSEHRQKEVLKTINNRTKIIEQCQIAVLIRKLAKDTLDWLNHDPHVRQFYEDYKNLKTFSEEILKEKYNEFLEFKKDVKKKQHEVKAINRHAEFYHRDKVNIVHSKEVKEAQHNVTELFKTFWNKIDEMEKQYQSLLGGSIERISTPSDESVVNDVTERFSDSTLEEKIQQTEDQKADIQMSFVKELELYQNNPTDVGCAFVNNIQRIRDIYSKYAINNVKHNSFQHSSEVTKFFKSILDKYSGENKEKGNQLFDLDFDGYSKRSVAVDVYSGLIWPVQRLCRYALIVDNLIKLAPYKITEIEEVKDEIAEITLYANDYVKLADLEEFTLTSDDVFCMTDEFIVTEPKKVFKREIEYQVFLFETSILLTKKKKTEKNAVKFVPTKEQQIMLSDVFVVEHVDSSTIKFGLRKRNAGAVSSSDNTIIFKAENEKTQKRWVKKLREFTVNIQHSNHESSSNSKKGSTSTLGGSDYYRSFRSPHGLGSSSRPSSTAESSSSNRNSRSSRDSCEIPPPTPPTNNNNGHGPGLSTKNNYHPSANGIEEFNDTQNHLTLENGGGNGKDNHVGFRLSQWPKD